MELHLKIEERKIINKENSKFIKDIIKNRGYKEITNIDTIKSMFRINRRECKTEFYFRSSKGDRFDFTNQIDLDGLRVYNIWFNEDLCLFFDTNGIEVNENYFIDVAIKELLIKEE